LKNDQIAKEKTTMTAYDDARGREYMASIGYDVDEFERDMRNLRTHDRLLQQSRQGLQAPAQRYGGLGTNQVLNDAYYTKQVLDCGS
jgi:hypothetical protein